MGQHGKRLYPIKDKKMIQEGKSQKLSLLDLIIFEIFDTLDYIIDYINESSLMYIILSPIIIMLFPFILMKSIKNHKK